MTKVRDIVDLCFYPPRSLVERTVRAEVSSDYLLGTHVFMGSQSVRPFETFS